uniref:hypothetical protein n=1 Tax=Alistipes shahii TaxID=328814 RepID=UPI00307BE3A9
GRKNNAPGGGPEAGSGRTGGSGRTAGVGTHGWCWSARPVWERTAGVGAHGWCGSAIRGMAREGPARLPPGAAA